VQSLIEKQKRNLEDFDKIKKEFGSKNFVLGMLDAYNGNKPSYNEIRQDKTDREATKNTYENREGF